MKGLVLGILGVAAIGGGGYLIYKNKKESESSAEATATYTEPTETETTTEKVEGFGDLSAYGNNVWTRNELDKEMDALYNESVI